MKNINFNSWLKPLVVLLLVTGLSQVAIGKDSTYKTDANVMVEIGFTAKQSYNDPFNKVTLDVLFKNPRGEEFRVPAFWAGTNLWKVRYASPLVGKHTFKTVCSESQDKGLHGVTGKVEVKTYQGSNLLYLHGPMKLSSNRRYMEYNDGKPFFWMGDTWWMGLSHRLHWPEDVQKLAQDRKQKGFNVIQLVAGLFPDMHPFDPRGANEAGYPWQTNYTSIRPEYFDAADKRLLYLVDQGFTPVIVGAWGYFLPWMGVDKAKAHWRYLIARYGALPVVWCTAGEANLDWYLTKGFPHDDREQIKGWTEVTRYLRATDPYHRLITIHPTGLGRLSARHAMDDLSLIDIDMLQTPHGQRDAVAPTVNTVRESYADKPIMPIINGEAAFEMLGDNLPTEWTRRMFWLCMMNGTAGHTYGANGIWQVNRKNDPHGSSPQGNGVFGYGRISWDEAMNLPGSSQVAFGKKLFEQYEWHKFTPHPEWASFSNKPSLSFDGCQWIWFPEGEPTKSAPPEKRFFRKTFLLPESRTVKSAELRVSVDNQFTAYLNGELIGAGNNWQAGSHFNISSARFKAGTNLLAIAGENLPDPGANPAGLLACLKVEFNEGKSLREVSDATWVCSKSEEDGWKTTIGENGWLAAKVLGKHGDAPWGRIESGNSNGVYGPQATGIPNGVRLIYVPESNPIEVHELGAFKLYRATYFDPVTGEKTSPAEIKADETGSWSSPSPSFRLAGQPHDWVLIMEPKK